MPSQRRIYPPLPRPLSPPLPPPPARRPPPWLAQVESQKRASEMTLRRAAFTAAQLDEVPDDVRMYRQVGKA